MFPRQTPDDAAISPGAPPAPRPVKRPAPLRQHRLPYLEPSEEVVKAARAAIGNARKNTRATATNKASSDWELSEEDVERVILRAGGRCELSGLPFDVTPDPKSPTRRRPKAPSLDRIDNRKGYTLRNVHLVLQLLTLPQMNQWDSYRLRDGSAEDCVTPAGI